MAGTNAPGLVLRTGRPASVFATEHWCESVSDWVCYAAPIRDVTGRVLGVVDLSADWRHAHPLALTTISSIARLIEHELAANPGLTRPELAITAMGEPTVRLDGVPVGLTRRQVEILTLLALHPDGLTLVELQEQLFGDRPLSPATVKAEVSRLRASIGRGIGSRPYRITLAYHLDASTALDALGRDDLETALRLYRGPLLPTSDSPALTQLRHHIDVALGDGLRRAGTAEQKRRFATRQPYGHRLDQGAGASWSTRQL